MFGFKVGEDWQQDTSLSLPWLLFKSLEKWGQSELLEVDWTLPQSLLTCRGDGAMAEAPCMSKYRTVPLEVVVESSQALSGFSSDCNASGKEL